MALEIRQVSKRFGAVQALDDVSLTLNGRVIALMGPNGAGKSTLLRILATVEKPDTGCATFNGLDYQQHLLRLRPRIGYLPQALDFPTHWRVGDLLSYFAHLRAVREIPSTLIHGLDLMHLLRATVGTLSTGELRRVGIAQALLGEPRLLLLDELTAGLDTPQRNRVFRLLHATQAQIIFSTHIPEEAAAHANQCLWLRAGKIDESLDTP